MKSLKKIMQYAKPYRRLLNWVVVWAVLLSVFAAVRPYVFQRIIDDYLFQSGSRSGFLLFVGFMAVILIAEVVMQFFFTFLANRLGQDVIKDIRSKLIEHILSFKMRYFDQEPVGKLVTRVVSDIEAISSIFSQGLFMIVSDVLKMLIVLIFMFSINWKISLIVVAIMPVILYATNIFQRKMKVAFAEVRNEVANLNTFVQERLTGMKIVQLFNREAIESQKFRDINQKHNKAWLKNILYNSIFFPIADMLSSITLGLVVYIGALLIVNGDTETTLGHLISFNMYISMLYMPLRQIADKFNVLQMGIVASERVFEILDTESNVQNSGKTEVETLSGTLVFKDVRFSYKQGEEVLKGINLEVHSGQTVAIVGSTGAGKSTIINLLNRFYDVDTGAISIGGTPISDFTLESLRKRIAVVLQDVFLFADTIYNNITLYNPNITREQVIAAAKKIGIHRFIMELPQGYDYNVKERGVMLSAGQRQLIIFLRAYLSNPDILVLDEATSSIDSHSEELIQQATETLTQNRTSIVIAHRLATIMKANTIIVMDKGKIVEQGSHSELVKIENGYYKKLYESQFAMA